MKHHRRMIRRFRRLALGLAAIASFAPAGALAHPAHDTGTGAHQAAGGHQAATEATANDRTYGAYTEAMAALSPEQLAAAFGTDWLHATASPATIGDTPADSPDASRALSYVPPSTVARPERTIVRDVNQELPIVLAALALLIALGSAGYTHVRTRSPNRGRIGRSH
jgi:hypothetical protein